MREIRVVEAIFLILVVIEFRLSLACRGGQVMLDIASLQDRAAAERREAEQTTGRRNDVVLAVRQDTIDLLAESGRQ